MFREALQVFGATLCIGQAPPGGLEWPIQRASDNGDNVDDEPMPESAE